MKLKQLRQQNGGFTLIEILVVVAIIGMLTAVVAINTNAARVQSRDAKRKTDAANVAASLEVYFSEKRQYPGATKLPNGTTNPTPMTSFNAGNTWNSLKAQLYPTYVSNWPTDPTGTDGTFGTGFVYQTNPDGAPNSAASGSYFAIDVPLEENQAVTNPEITAATPNDLTYYVTGTYTASDGKTHFRESVR